MNTTAIQNVRPRTRIMAALVAIMLALSVVGGTAAEAHAAPSVGRIVYSIAGSITKVSNASKVKICFNANGGRGKMSNQMVMFNAMAMLKNNTFIRAGYTFVGWNTKPNGKGKAYVGRAMFSSISKNRTITLYAQWKKKPVSLNRGWWAIDSKGRKITSAYSMYYTGKYQNPIAGITNGKTIIKRPAYAPFCHNNKNVGRAYVVVKGVSSRGYKDSFKVYFNIKHKPARCGYARCY